MVYFGILRNEKWGRNGKDNILEEYKIAWQNALYFLLGDKTFIFGENIYQCYIKVLSVSF